MEPAAVLPRSGLRRWTPRVALVACGFGAAMLWHAFGTDPIPDSTGRPEGGAQPTIAQTHRVEDPASRRGVVLPDLPDRLLSTERSPRSRPATAAHVPTVRELQRLALRRDLARDLLPMTLLRAMTLGAPMPPAASATASLIAEQMRLEATAALAQSSDPRAIAALAEIIASEPPGATLEEMVRAARTAGVGERLLHALEPQAPSETLLVLAAVIGEPRLDAALGRAVEGNREATDRIALSSQRVVDRPGRVTFLLRLWSDLRRRGLERLTSSQLGAAVDAESAAEARARSWFGSLPAAATQELVDEARRTRRTEHRERCLLALAARGDASAADGLLELVQGPRYDEAELAAYALGRCPADQVASRLRHALRRTRHPELLLAALASAQCADLASWLGDLDLTAEEQRFLRAGKFHREQFRIASCLFRNRHAGVAF
jgi:hypothetical protein